MIRYTNGVSSPVRRFAGALLPVVMALGACHPQPPSQEPARAHIRLSLDRILGPSRPLLVGQNFNYFDRAGHTWDVSNERFYPAVTDALREEHPSILRYPGGLHGNSHHFDQTIGPLDRRTDQATLDGDTTPYTGVDEFMALVEGTPGAQALNIVSMINSREYGGGTPEEAAAWVAYCNASTDDTTTIGVDAFGKDWHTAGYWATRREENGHAAPYGVTWWELGNEVNIDYVEPNPLHEAAMMTAESYVSLAGDFITAMRAVDPSIKIVLTGGARPAYGQPMEDLPSMAGGGPWAETVYGGLSGRFDAVALHLYSPIAPELPDLPSLQRDEDLYVHTAFAYDRLVNEPFITQTGEWLDRYAPGASIWVTEFSPAPALDHGAGFDLLSALLTADMIMGYAGSPNVEASQKYGFNTGGYGSIFAGDGRSMSGRTFHDVVFNEGELVRFPVHWALSMFADSAIAHQGGQLLQAEVEVDETQFYLDDVGSSLSYPAVRAVAAVTEDGHTVDVLMLNTNIDSSIRVDIDVDGTTAVTARQLNTWNRDGIDALLREENVGQAHVTVRDIDPPEITSHGLSTDLAPHSLTLLRVTLGGG